MKPLLLTSAVCLLASTLLTAQSPFTHSTAATFSSCGHFNADALIDAARCDKASGLLTLLVQQADGSFLTETHPSGIEGVTAMAVGSYSGAAPQQVALTAPDHNRIDLLPSRIAITVPGIGPDLLVATPVGGAGDDPASMDLLAGSNWNDGPAVDRLDTVRPDGSAVTGGPSGARHREGNPFLFETGGLSLAGVIAAAEFRVYSASSGEPLLISSVAGLILESHWSWLANSAGQSVLLVHDGSDVFQSFLTSAPPGFDAPLAWALSQPVRQLVRLERPGGDRLCAIYADGTAEIFSFDGLTAPVSVDILTAPPGEGFDAAVVLGNGDFMLLTPGSWQRRNETPGGYVLAHQGGMPGGGGSALVASRPNIFLFTNAPFVTNSPGYQQSQRLGEWTNSSGDLAAGMRDLDVESLASESQGLQAAGIITINEPASSYVLANQYLPDLSFHGLGPVEASPRAAVVFSPGPATYAPAPTASPELDPDELPLAAVLVTAQAQPSDQTVHYRLNDGPWTADGHPVKITTTSTLQAYAEDPATGKRSSITDGRYVVASPSALGIPASPDLDGDGLADAWETAFGQTNPNADPDGDGFNNLTEQNNGTDPLAGNTAAPPLEIHLNMLPGGQIELTWSAALGAVTLWWSENLVDWHPVTPAPAGNSHSEPITEARRYFRLKSP